MQQLPFGRNRLGPRNLIRPIHVGLVDLVAAHRDDALTDHRLHVLARDPRVHVVHLHAGHALGVLDGFADRARRFLDVRHDAAAHPCRARLTDAQHFDRWMLRQIADDFADDGGRFRGAEVESGDEAIRIHWSRAITWSR